MPNDTGPDNTDGQRPWWIFFDKACTDLGIEDRELLSYIEFLGGQLTIFAECIRQPVPNMEPWSEDGNWNISMEELRKLKYGPDDSVTVDCVGTTMTYRKRYLNTLTIDKEIVEEIRKYIVDAEGINPQNTIIKMQAPKTKDDWFLAIRDCIRAFEKETGYTPNEVELWIRLRQNPPASYGVTYNNLKKELLLAGESPMDREAFGKRYARLYP